MLKLFDKYYRRGDPKAMAVSRPCTLREPRRRLMLCSFPQHCAQTLQEFNGGQSCIQIYVNQHDFFISKERVNEAAGSLVGGAMLVRSLLAAELNPVTDIPRFPAGSSSPTPSPPRPNPSPACRACTTRSASRSGRRRRSSRPCSRTRRGSCRSSSSACLRR